MTWTPTPGDTPFTQLGGEAAVLRIVERFYARMASDEPELAHLHEVTPQGLVSERTQERFGRFFIEWLGGPPVFSPIDGHPRLRMRHAHVPVNEATRDAWLRCMQAAFDDEGVTGGVREFLDLRLAEVANFLRNSH